MSTGSKRKTAKALSLIVSAVGIVVIVGWILNIGILKSLSGNWISMKFDTAIAFVFSGISLYVLFVPLGMGLLCL